jgi:hypothetical protein
MRQSKFTEEQIVALLREAEKGELTIQALAKDRGIAQQGDAAHKRHIRRRAAVEPAIGHMKKEGLLGRNFLKGMKGDAMNAALCGVGHNLRKILAKVRFGLYRWLAAWTIGSSWTQLDLSATK